MSDREELMALRRMAELEAKAAGSSAEPTVQTPAQPDPLANIPNWAARHPTAYGIAGAARESLGPFIEGGGALLGGLAGGTVGALSGPGAFATAVGGSALGYGMGKGINRLADVALGNTSAPTLSQAALQSGEDVALGAGMDMAGRGLIAPAIKYGTKTLGWLGDAFQGQLANVKAGRIGRQLAGQDLDAIRAANATTDSNLTAGQAAQNVNNPVWSAFTQFGERTNPSMATEFFRKRGATQQTAEDVMANLAGGRSAEETALTRDWAVKRLELELGPERTLALKQAATAGTLLPEMIAKLGQREQAYISALQTQGQMATGAAQATSGVMPGRVFAPNQNLANPNSQISLDLQSINNQGATPRSLVRTASGSQKPIDVVLANQFNGASQDAATIAAQRKAEADFMHGQITSLQNEGLKPFTTAPIVQNLEGRLASKVGQMNDSEQSVLKAVLDKLKIAGDDPYAVAELRRMSVNNLIGDLVQSGKVNKDAAASALINIKKQIDSSIVNAGGEGWITKYMEPYAKGMAEKDALTLIDKLRVMQKDSPNEFINTMKGENMDLLAEYSPTAKSLREFLGSHRFDAIKNIATNMERSGKLAEQSDVGAGLVSDVFAKSKFGFKFPGFISKEVTTLNALISAGEASLNNNTRRVIAEGVRSGKTANEMLNVLPLSERNKILASMQSNPWIGKSAGGAIAGTNGLFNAFIRNRNNNALATQE